MSDTIAHDLFDKLVYFALKRGVVFQDAEDLVQDTLITALGAHDQARGTFKTLSFTVLNNKIKNFQRDNRPAAPFDERDYAHGFSETVLERELKESEELMQKMLSRVERLLKADELSFLKELRIVAEMSESILVSETSRRLGLTPEKGWDIFRRIQRKVQKDVQSDTQVQLDRAGGRPVLHRIAPPATPFRGALVRASHPLGLSVTPEAGAKFYSLVASLGVLSGFDAFYDALDPEKRQQLERWTLD